MTFYLIRHGQTEWNAIHRVMSRLDIPLDEVGEKQTDDLAEVLRSFPIQRIYSSPQLRAQQTAQKIAVVKNLPVQSNPLLSEMDFKLWEGKMGADLRNDEIYLNRRKDFFNFQHPEVESFQSLFSRVGEFADQVYKADDHVVMVSHMDVVRAMIVKLLQVPVESFFKFKVQNASCTILKKKNDIWMLELMNFTKNPLQALDI